MGFVVRKCLQSSAVGSHTTSLARLGLYANTNSFRDTFNLSITQLSIIALSRQENQELIEEGDDTLRGTRQLWLHAMENFPKDKSAAFLSLQKEDLLTRKAWSFKENFRNFWERKTIEDVEVYFRSWCLWSTRSKLMPIVNVATIPKRHLEGSLAYITDRLTNTTSEGFNSRI